MSRNPSPPHGRVIRALRHALARVRRFATSNSGNTMMLFALCIVPLIGFVGAAIDYSRALSARTMLKSAADAAVLAGGREWQNTDPDEDPVAAAINKTKEFFDAAVNANENMHQQWRIENPLATVAVDGTNGTIDIIASAEVKTLLLPVIGISKIDIAAASQVALPQGNNIEVALMLDTSESMSQETQVSGDIPNDLCEEDDHNTKLCALKVAAHDLIQIVVQDNQPGFTQRVALAPFNDAVNVGEDDEGEGEEGGEGYFDEVTGGEQDNDSDGDDDGSNAGNEESEGEGEHEGEDDDEHNRPCVVERPGAAAFTDDAPTADKYLGIWNSKRITAPEYVDNELLEHESKCKQEHAIMPLTNDKDKLNDAIGELEAEGYGTAGHLGTAWAWYLLSPNWSSIWPDAAAGSYGTSNLTKYAILMTDGMNNTSYEGGNGTSYTQALTLCANMKAAGITVYTIGFDLDDQNALDLLKTCATTEESHFFTAGNGDELGQAFRTIAYQIAKLRLTK